VRSICVSAWKSRCTFRIVDHLVELKARAGRGLFIGTVKIRVLGSAAGGGFPQWNCNCRNCSGVRSGTVRTSPRTQSSIVVGGNTADEFVLINASPDILSQLKSFEQLQPARQIRDTALKSIVLVDGQIDHTTGLFMLREARAPWPIWCTPAVHRDLTDGNPILKVLDHYCGIEWNPVDLSDAWFEVKGAEGVRWKAFNLSSKPAPFSPNRAKPIPGDNIGLFLEDQSTHRKLFYAPGLGGVDDKVWEYMRAADCVLVDGTFWAEDEMLALGLSSKFARDMGHLPQSGAGGMIEWLDRLPSSTRKVLIHINNSNPILDEDSTQRADLRDHGIEVAYDGMEIEP
jgi:pyrroloquinoline quinone biosynthesis protein B